MATHSRVSAGREGLCLIVGSPGGRGAAGQFCHPASRSRAPGRPLLLAAREGGASKAGSSGPPCPVALSIRQPDVSPALPLPSSASSAGPSARLPGRCMGKQRAGTRPTRVLQSFIRCSWSSSGPARVRFFVGRAGMARPRDRPSPQQRQPAQRGRGPDGLRLQVRRGAAPTQGTSRPGRPGSRATERLISQGESEAVEERQLGLG